MGVNSCYFVCTFILCMYLYLRSVWTDLKLNKGWLRLIPVIYCAHTSISYSPNIWGHLKLTSCLQNVFTNPSSFYDCVESKKGEHWWSQMLYSIILLCKSQCNVPFNKKMDVNLSSKYILRKLVLNPLTVQHKIGYKSSQK